MNGNYDGNFFSHLQPLALNSARVVCPILLNFVKPSSVVDLGCGQGTWLSVFADMGIIDFQGIDGSYVDEAMLDIPASSFQSHDLEQPFHTDRTFDLALCLEVAEHLPEACATDLVASLAKLAPVVAFSAAIPHQVGENHVNCQWPDYWSERFSAHGFRPFDCLRPLVWGNEDVAWWYQQNLILYVRTEVVASYPELASAHVLSPNTPLRLTHPALLQHFIDWGMEQSQLYWEVQRESQ